MRKIKLMLEYKCFPIWIYDETNELIDNDLPEEIKDFPRLEKAFDSIQEIYDNLYLDDGIEFKYIGFCEEEKKKEFGKRIDIATQMLVAKLDGKYVIEHSISY